MAYLTIYYWTKKQVYIKLSKAKMRIMQVNCLCEIYHEIFIYLIAVSIYS